VNAEIDRRARAPLRVPFVRQCTLWVEGFPGETALLVNINTLGAYVARELMPVVGQGLRLRFGLPGSVLEIEVEAVVAWTHSRPHHPIHSLPTGFGASFRDLSPEARRAIEAVVHDYQARRSRMRKGR
jgi:hypothetical protein